MSSRALERSASVAYALGLFIAVSFTACGNSYVDQTAVRFTVYSDLPLTRLDAVVLDEQGQPSTRANTFMIPTGSLAATTYLASIVVERTSASKSRSSAQIRLDGYIDGVDGPKVVVQRTARAQFTDKQTRVGKVFLARTCAATYGEDPSCPTPRFSCDYTSGQCLSDETPLTLSDYAPETDERARWLPDNYHNCGDSADTVCPPRCTLAEDPDCRNANGAVCHAATECLSGVCARACTDPSCTDLRCAEGPCGEACTVVDSRGSCSHFVFDMDVNNCGSCGRACSTNHAAPTCQGGKCLKACSPGFDDCNADLWLDGCEINLTTSADHCGGCSMPGEGCHYGVCQDSKCLGTVIGLDAARGERAMPQGQLFLKLVRIVVPSLVAVGIHVADGSLGTVTLIVLEALPSGEPGNVLFAQDVSLRNSTTNTRGEFFGTELPLSPPLPVQSGPFWLGFVFAQTTNVKTMDRPESADRRVSTDPITTFDKTALPPLTRLDTRQADEASDPLLYAVYLKQ